MTNRITLTKDVLVSYFGQRMGDIVPSKQIQKKCVQAVLDGLSDMMAVPTEAGELNIEIRGFGTFRIRIEKAHQARNPKTGGKVSMPERTAVRFKASPALRKMIQ
jgi:integration host factor subunit beta